LTLTIDTHEEGLEFRYCPVCGGTLRSLQLKAIEPIRPVCSSCGFVLYLDPKLVACTVVPFDDKIVLLKRGIDPQMGKWVPPGGYVDRGETVEGAAIRETHEECGLVVEIESLLGVYSYPGRTPVVLVYVTRYVSGTLTAGDETKDVRLFSNADIPWEELAFPSTVDALRDYFKIKA
jgi:ADP-ribose pyrophosphatase YjhB (NUDIX family)